MLNKKLIKERGIFLFLYVLIGLYLGINVYNSCLSTVDYGVLTYSISDLLKDSIGGSQRFITLAKEIYRYTGIVFPSTLFLCLEILFKKIGGIALLKIAHVIALVLYCYSISRILDLFRFNKVTTRLVPFLLLGLFDVGMSIYYLYNLTASIQIMWAAVLFNIALFIISDELKNNKLSIIRVIVLGIAALVGGMAYLPIAIMTMISMVVFTILEFKKNKQHKVPAIVCVALSVLGMVVNFYLFGGVRSAKLNEMHYSNTSLNWSDVTLILFALIIIVLASLKIIKNKNESKLRNRVITIVEIVLQLAAAVLLLVCEGTKIKDIANQIGFPHKIIALWPTLIVIVLPIVAYLLIYYFNRLKVCKKGQLIRIEIVAILIAGIMNMTSVYSVIKSEKQVNDYNNQNIVNATTNHQPIILKKALSNYYKEICPYNNDIEADYDAVAEGYYKRFYGISEDRPIYCFDWYQNVIHYNLDNNLIYNSENGYYYSGYSFEEDWGRWTSDNTSSVEFYINSLERYPASTRVLEIEAMAYAVERNTSIYVNNVLVQTVSISVDGDHYELELDNNQLKDGINIITIISDGELTTPREYEGIDDLRTLCLGIKKLIIH